MMSATFVTVMIRPVSAPASAATMMRTIASTIVSRKLTGCPVVASNMYFAERTLMRLISEPTERSIPPEMTTTACAIAAKANGSASIASDWTSKVPHPAGIVRQ